MLHIKVEVLEGGAVSIPFMNLIVQDFSGGDSKEYAYQQIARQLGHTHFTLEEEITESL